MINYENIWIEHYEGLRIRDAISSKVPLLFNFSHVLITCIDSGDELQFYDDVIAKLSKNAELSFIEGSILLTTDNFFSNENVHSIFDGWDTIWFLKRHPNLVMTNGLTLTTDYSLLDKDSPYYESKLNNLKVWVNSVGDCFGLGDGDGTDCVATNPEYIAMFSEWYRHWDSIGPEHFKPNLK